MSKNLVIVESPAKAKTIKKYLGKDFTVLASYGHVRDLLPKEGAVDTEHDFAMKYQPIEKNEKHFDAIAKEMKKADALYLATDPDREGEAISWHLCELLKEKKLLDKKAVRRVVFHEITKRAVQEAVEHPRDISMDLINAQQARRALDYLVGFNLSPLLWKKIRPGLSAGRVQSPALRMIVERELEIEKFVSPRILDHRSGSGQGQRDLYRQTAFLRGQEACPIQRHHRGPGQGHRGAAAKGRPGQGHRQQSGEEAAQAQSRAALHHLHPAAGSLTQAELHRAKDHAHRPAAL